jgi:Glycosyl hydrolase family 1
MHVRDGDSLRLRCTLPLGGLLHASAEPSSDNLTGFPGTSTGAGPAEHAHVCERRRAQDILEWIYGFGDRFGLIYVDFKTLERTPKLSAEWFGEAARQNAVV